MKCKCGLTLNHVECDDRNQQSEPDFCYNLYVCECGTILFEDVHNSKEVWINATDTEVEIKSSKFNVST